LQLVYYQQCHFCNCRRWVIHSVIGKWFSFQRNREYRMKKRYDKILVLRQTIKNGERFAENECSIRFQLWKLKFHSWIWYRSIFIKSLSTVNIFGFPILAFLYIIFTGSLYEAIWKTQAGRRTPTHLIFVFYWDLRLSIHCIFLFCTGWWI